MTLINFGARGWKRPVVEVGLVLVGSHLHRSDALFESLYLLRHQRAVLLVAPSVSARLSLLHSFRTALYL